MIVLGDPFHRLPGTTNHVCSSRAWGPGPEIGGVVVMEQCKVDAVKTYGGQIVQCDRSMDAREATCARLQEESGATFIHPYDYAPTICGQGTLALELLEQVWNHLTFLLY